YLAKFLYNKAANWVRDWRAREKKSAFLAEAGEDRGAEALASGAAFRSREENVDLAIVFTKLWNELDPHLRLLWNMLAEEQGNQTQVARRLGKHRNTVRLWVRRIKQILERHGFRSKTS